METGSIPQTRRLRRGSYNFLEVVPSSAIKIGAVAAAQPEWDRLDIKERARFLKHLTGGLLLCTDTNSIQIPL